MQTPSPAGKSRRQKIGGDRADFPIWQGGVRSRRGSEAVPERRNGERVRECQRGKVDHDPAGLQHLSTGEFDAYLHQSEEDREFDQFLDQIPGHLLARGRVLLPQQSSPGHRLAQHLVRAKEHFDARE